MQIDVKSSQTPCVGSTMYTECCRTPRYSVQLSIIWRGSARFRRSGVLARGQPWHVSSCDRPCARLGRRIQGADDPIRGERRFLSREVRTRVGGSHERTPIAHRQSPRLRLARLAVGESRPPTTDSRPASTNESISPVVADGCCNHLGDASCFERPKAA